MSSKPVKLQTEAKLRKKIKYLSKCLSVKHFPSDRIARVKGEITKLEEILASR